MNKEEKNYFINHELINKEDVIDSVEQYIEYCETTKEEKWSSKKREVLIDLLSKFLHLIEEMDFPTVTDDNWFYEYLINNEGVKLLLTKCDDIEIDENDNASMDLSGSIAVAEVIGEYLNVEKYAREYGVKDTTVRQWIRRGKIRSAKKLGRDWIIPILADKPRRGYESVTYTWDNLSAEILCKYPFLKYANSLSIRKSEMKGDMYEISLQSDTRLIPTVFYNISQREKFELSLISEPDVKADEWDQHCMFMPEKKRRYAIKGGKIVAVEDANNAYESIVKMEEDDLNIKTSSMYYDEDGKYVWRFSATLNKAFSKGDKTVANIKSGIIIPAEVDFMFSGEYATALELCDEISADLGALYKAIGTDGDGIKPEIIQELGMKADASYEAEILVIEDIAAENKLYLSKFLNMFDEIKQGLPAEYCKLAVGLLAWESEGDKIKVFLDAGWKLRNIDSKTVIVYRKI